MREPLTAGIFVLLKSALTGAALPLPEAFVLEEAVPQIRRHRIENLIYYGAANCGIDTGLPVMRELFAATYRYLRTDMQQRQALERLYAAFEANNIDYMPLKGAVMKALYPKPDMRAMGDADILIRLPQYDKIRPLLQEMGYTEKVESDHELIWTGPGLYLELHKRVIPSYNTDYAAYFGDGWPLAEPCPGSDNRYQMSDENQLIYQFTHFAKHYRDGGIGLRHLADLYMYRMVKPELDQAYIDRELKRLQLDAFYKNVWAAMDSCFDGGEETLKTQCIEQMILDSGVYGSAEGHIAAQGVREMAWGDNARQVRRKQWLRLLFLPYPEMCEKYPVLEKIPALLPAFWIHRWLVAIFRKPESIRTQSARMQTMSEDRIESFDQALRAVGLAFHFKE